MNTTYLFRTGLWKDLIIINWEVLLGETWKEFSASESISQEKSDELKKPKQKRINNKMLIFRTMISPCI